MTHTAIELMNSKGFWKSRMDQQEQYIGSYRLTGSPYSESVWKSAWAILEYCRFMHLSCYVLDELNEVYEPEEVKRLFRIHLESWNEHAEYGRVLIHEYD